MSDDLVKSICQMWIADGRAKECFWDRHLKRKQGAHGKTRKAERRAMKVKMSKRP